MLTTNQLTNVCMAYQNDSNTCRYLDVNSSNYQKWNCLKLRAGDKKNIDGKIDKFLVQCSVKGINPDDQHVPLGDNCAGYPMLKHINQGYDVPDQ